MNKKVKKLSLSRETVKKLQDEVLQGVAGGLSTVETCISVCPCTSGDCSITKRCSGCCP
jgi:hypothetical protein